MKPLHLSCLLLAALAAPQLRGQQALRLTTNIDGGIDVPTNPVMVPPTGITVEAWIAYDDRTIPTNGFYWPTIARQNIAAGQETWNFRVDASNNASRSLRFYISLNGQHPSVSYTFAAGEFTNYTHVAGTYDGSSLRLYKNGVQVASTAVTTPGELVYNNGILRIGNGDPSAPGREVWNGIIDELRVWPIARTQAEIQATMNQSLSGLPGGCMTFTLDGHTIDTSNGLFGTAFGTTSFLQGAPVTAVSQPLLATVGSATTNCTRQAHALIGSMPQIGNSAFAVWVAQAPTPANAPAGVLFGAAAQAPPGLQILGVNLALDPTQLLFQSILTPATIGLGSQRVGIPIPFDNTLVGINAVFQWGFAYAACGSQGWTGSDGVQFRVF